MKSNIIALVIGFILGSSLFIPNEEKEGERKNLCQNLVHFNKTIWSPLHKTYIYTNTIVEHCKWFLVSQFSNATIIWSTGHSDMKNNQRDLKEARFGQGQIWNQLEDGWSITDKVRLHRLLAKIGRTDLQPDTYVLTDEDECLKFFREVPHKPDIIWVTKISDSSQGDGIVVNPKLEDLRQEYLVDPDAPADKMQCIPKERKILIQQYVLNPLLLEGKKMEIRTYWMIASLEPLMVFYHDGTVRLTTRDYKNDEWDDPLIHITNTKQQKKADPNYENTAGDRKWTVPELSEYLLSKGMITDKDLWLEKLRNTLKEYIAIVAKASYPHFMSLKTIPGYDGRFELFGMDVILDTQLRPWLTEMQDGPSLSIDRGTIKEVLIPEMLVELTDVILEIDQIRRFGNEEELNNLTSPREWVRIDLEKY